MILYVIDPVQPAHKCKLIYDNITGEGRVMLSDDLELPKNARILCTTLEEFTILKHLGYDVRHNPHPSDATLNGVDVETANTDPGKPAL